MSYTLYLNGTKVNRVYVVGEHDYTPQLQPPVIINNNNTITIENVYGENDYQIYYTTDGTIPTPTNGTLYTQPFMVGTGTTVKAITHYAGTSSGSVKDSDYAEITTGAISIGGYPYGEPFESGHSLRDNVPYFCVGTPDNGEHYYLMKNSNWSEDVYNTKTSYYDNGTPVTIGTDVNGRLYIASEDIANPTLYKRTLSRGLTSFDGHYYGTLQFNDNEGFYAGTRLWNDPNAYGSQQGLWVVSDQGASWYSGYRLKYGAVTHGSNNLGNCFYLSTDTTNDYSIMFFKAVSQVIYINN